MEGGVGAFTQELARALALAGHDVHIITDVQVRPAEYRKGYGDRFDPYDIKFAQLHPRVYRWRWNSLATVVDVVVRYDLDVINIQYQAAAYNMRNPAINFLPWRLKTLTKTAVTFHDLRVPYLFPKAGRLRRMAVNFMARQADGVIVTNHEDYQSLNSHLQTPLRQVPIGSNITTYSPNHIEVAEARELAGVGDRDCLLGYFGFLNESKGADTLLRALARLDARFHLIFIGGQTGSSDPDNNQTFLDQIKRLAVDLKVADRVHWTGFVTDQRVSTFLHAADMMVMPYRDGVSLRRGTLMAVLAHGRPLITTIPTTPTPEIIHGQNAWLIPPDDDAVLSQAITTLAADPNLCARLGQGAVLVADLFTWDKIAEQTADFFRDLISPT